MAATPPLSDDLLQRLVTAHAPLPADEGGDKVMPLSQAVASLVAPRTSLYFGFGHARAHAAAFEIARRFWGTRPDFHLITAGVLEFGLVMLRGDLVKRITAAYAGNTYPMPSPNRVMRQAVAGGVHIEEATNLTITTRLLAGALGLPFIPTRSVGGTSLATPENGYAEAADPFAEGEKVGVLRALRPDLAVLHAYAADRAGNAILLGPYGEESWGALAARGGVLLTVEKLVSTEFIRSHAHLVRLPGHVVRSVTVAPFGAHPQPMTNFGLPGHAGYGEDYEFRRGFQEASRSDSALDEWIANWVIGCADHDAYLRRLGSARLEGLRGSLSADVWSARLGDRLEAIPRDPVPTRAETMIILAAREIIRRVRACGHTTVLAGAGVANLAAWLAVGELKREGASIELIAEAGSYGYAPRFGDPYVFSLANMFTNKMHSGFLCALGLLAGGADNRCLAVVGAGQVDRLGNINSSRQGDGSFLVGSGGANDLGNTAREVLVLCAASPQRLVETVPYVTTSGRSVATLVTPLGVFEKAEDGAFRVARLAPAAGPPQQRLDALASACGWPLRQAGTLGEHAPISATELASLRLYDPERIFTA